MYFYGKAPNWSLVLLGRLVESKLCGLGFMQISPKLLMIFSYKLTTGAFGMKLIYECGNFKIKHPEGPQPEYQPLYSMESD